MAKIAFVIPFYNKSEEIFSRCLRSLKLQSLQDFEIVIVKDGPSIVPEKVVGSIFQGDARVKIIEIKHAGACAARNAGFKETTAPHVVFWDADCIIEPEISKQWVDILEKSNEFGFVYSGYRFMGDGAGGIASEPFDPWTLRVRNYISACFPVRRELVKEWDTNLESLQDWDFWLSVVESGAKGRFVRGFAFSTQMPDKDSISGKGCANEVWLSRVNAVKKKHNLPDRNICVSAPLCREDGILLAKSINADYQDFPEFKPHSYDTIVKIGFSLEAGRAVYEANTLKNPDVKNKYLFWMPEDITTIYYRQSLRGIQIYSALLNSVCTKQFVECKKSKDLMQKAGFNVEITPLPLKSGEPKPLPTKPCWLLDIGGEYDGLEKAIAHSLPDIKTVVLSSGAKIEEFTGIVHLYEDALLTSAVKRMLVSGRHVISNIKSEYCGCINGDTTEKMLRAVVNMVRAKSNLQPNIECSEFWQKKLDPKHLQEKINERTCQLCHS